MTTNLLRRSKNPVAAGPQADGIAFVQLPVARRVDLDHSPALTRAQRHLGALNGAESAHMLHRAL